MKTVALPSNSFFFLMISLVLYFVVYPFVASFQLGGLLLKVFITLLLILSLYALSKKKKIFITSLLLVIPEFVLYWTSYFVPNRVLDVLSAVLILLFLVLVIIVFVQHLYSSNTITSDTIFGAVCIYGLMGVLWAFIYYLVAFFVPGSFVGQVATFLGTIDDFFYYSFVTLTTLGFGDISPATLHAKYFSVLEAVVGQLFIATTIARVVGIYIQSKKQLKHNQ